VKTTIKSFIISAVLLAGTLSSPAVNACAVCMGASDSTVAPAANGAIFFLIGVVGFVLSFLGGFIFYLARRAKYPAQIPPELADALAIISEEKQHA
jgi:hypothetical protein